MLESCSQHLGNTTQLSSLTSAAAAAAWAASDAPWFASCGRCCCPPPWQSVCLSCRAHPPAPAAAQVPPQPPAQVKLSKSPPAASPSSTPVKAPSAPTQVCTTLNCYHLAALAFWECAKMVETILQLTHVLILCPCSVCVPSNAPAAHRALLLQRRLPAYPTLEHQTQPLWLHMAEKPKLSNLHI